MGPAGGRQDAHRPEGFTIDLSACAAGAGATPRASPTPRSRSATPRRSPALLADYGNISKTTAAWFTYLGDNGAFKDSTGKTRKINYIVKDDGYDPARTIPLVDELLDSEKVFAIWDPRHAER